MAAMNSTRLAHMASSPGLDYGELLDLIYSDLYRYYGRTGKRIVLRSLLFGIGDKYFVWLRVTRFLRQKGRLAFPFFLLCRLIVRHYGFKFGIDIPWAADIGKGFYIGHFGGITISPLAVIGANCNISQGVTIGISNRGRIGVPTIGNNVFIGPGAKIFGKIRIGDNVAIGANTVVTRNVKSHSIVICGPADVIRCSVSGSTGMTGSSGYINDTDYPNVSSRKVSASDAWGGEEA